MQKVISRPLSPHLTVYRPQLTSTLSIFHRISGVLLSFVVIFFAFSYSFITHYLIFSSSFVFFFSSSFFLWFCIALSGFSLLAFHYHAINGIRHLCWDYGFFLDLKYIYVTGFFCIIFTCFFLFFNLIRIYHS